MWMGKEWKKGKRIAAKIWTSVFSLLLLLLGGTHKHCRVSMRFFVVVYSIHIYFRKRRKNKKKYNLQICRYDYHLCNHIFIFLPRLFFSCFTSVKRFFLSSSASFVVCRFLAHTYSMWIICLNKNFVKLNIVVTMCNK